MRVSETDMVIYEPEDFWDTPQGRIPCLETANQYMRVLIMNADLYEELRKLHG